MLYRAVILSILFLSCGVKDEMFVNEAERPLTKGDSFFANTIKAISIAKLEAFKQFHTDTAMKAAYTTLIVKYDTLLAQANRNETNKLELTITRNNLKLVQAENKALLTRLVKSENEKSDAEENLRQEKIRRT